MSELPLWLEGWLDWIALNPGWTLFLLALGAGIEGLFVIGLFIPGSVLMFAAGVLAAHGYLDPWAALICAALGAAVGDGCSYLLGRHYRDGMPAWTQRGALLPRAEAFFRRYGGLSLILGRLIGPLRPFVPAVAGAAGYPMRRFVPMILLASGLWAVAYALPGMAVGATLTVLAELLGRLSILVVALGILLFALLKLLSWLLTWNQRAAEPLLLRVIDWSHRHRRLRRLGPALADRDQPETPVLAAALAALLLLGLCLEALLRMFQSEPAARWNLALLDQLAGFRSPWTDTLGQILRDVGDPALIIAITVGSTLAFVLSGRMREAAHWLAGVGGGALLFLGLGTITMSPPPGVAAVATDGGAYAALGTGAVAGFVLAGLLATRRHRQVRLAIYWTLAIVVIVIGLAAMIQGVLLPDRAALLVVWALLWASLVILGFRRHQARRAGPAPGWPHLIGLGLCVILVPFPDVPRAATIPAEELLQRRPDRLNLLWEGDPAPVLQARGWQPEPSWQWAHLRAWLSRAPIQQLPAMPALLNGSPAAQVWRRDQEILRLWPDPEQDQHSAPHWVGHHGRLHLTTILGQLRIPQTQLSLWNLQSPAATSLHGIPQHLYRDPLRLVLRSPQPIPSPAIPPAPDE